jgi:hypothetical protein
LNRIISLGEVAKVIRDRSEKILEEIIQARKSDQERCSQLFQIQLGYEKKITEYQKANSDRKKVEIELALRGRGVAFTSAKEIRFKHNYTVPVMFVKILDVSASGKTCTVLFTFLTGYETTEENVNTQAIIDRVVALNKDIVSTSELV